MVNILQIQPHPVGKIFHLVSAGNLPEARDPGADAEPTALGIGGHGQSLIGRQGTRTHQAHLAEKDVEELGKFVEGGEAKKSSDAGDPRVLLDLEHGPLHLIQGLQLGFPHLGIAVHRAELVHGEGISVPSAAALSKKGRTGGLKFDRNPKNQEKGQEKKQKQRGSDSVKNHFGNGLPGAGPGGAEDQQIAAHDFLELGAGDLGADEIRAQPCLHSFLLTGLNRLGGPIHVPGADFKQDDSGGVLVQGLDEFFDRYGVGRQGARDLYAHGGIGEQVDPAVGMIRRFRDEEQADGVLLGASAEKMKAGKEILAQ